MSEDNEVMIMEGCEHKLIPYTFNIEYVPGKKHPAADALSRAPVFDGYEDASFHDADLHAAEVVSPVS